MCVLVTQSCLTLCDPMDCSLPSFSVHGILQARNWSRLLFPMPEDLPTAGIESIDSCISSIGRHILTRASLIAQSVKNLPAV